MRWKSKNSIKAANQIIETRAWFAWLPITIKGETRWLEKVVVSGYWFTGRNMNPVFMEQAFVDYD